MKIQSHEIAMASQHSFSRVELESQMSFSTVYFNTPPPNIENSAQSPNIKELELSSRFNSFMNETSQTLNGIIQNLMSMLSKRGEKVPDEQEMKGLGYNHFSLMQKYEEHEKLDFSTMGCIQTDTGSLSINVNFSMSRSFVIENHIDVFSSFDPLVINLDGDIPNLSTDTFSFDLDNDGECDQISTLGSGNGFLALDKNGDGIVNQGSELFGTVTGDGFGELSEYDEDSNNWIDENDTIFDKLQIWLKNEDTKEKELVGLGEVGIGAIFLDSQKGEFTYKTNTNQTLGEMKSCGVFLNEDGSCGNISQIDFASRELKKDAHKEKEERNNSHNEPLAELLMA
jgi:hypothetical protein